MNDANAAKLKSLPVLGQTIDFRCLKRLRRQPLLWTSDSRPTPIKSPPRSESPDPNGSSSTMNNPHSIGTCSFFKRDNESTGRFTEDCPCPSRKKSVQSDFESTKTPLFSFAPFFCTASFDLRRRVTDLETGAVFLSHSKPLEKRRPNAAETTDTVTTHALQDRKDAPSLDCRPHFSFRQ